MPKTTMHRMTAAEFEQLKKEELGDLPEVILFGTRYILVGGKGCIGWAIATHLQYETFRESYAHMQEDGSIFRYGDCIGNYKDLFLERKQK